MVITTAFGSASAAAGPEGGTKDGSPDGFGPAEGAWPVGGAWAGRMAQNARKMKESFHLTMLTQRLLNQLAGSTTADIEPFDRGMRQSAP